MCVCVCVRACVYVYVFVCGCVCACGGCVCLRVHESGRACGWVEILTKTEEKPACYLHKLSSILSLGASRFIRYQPSSHVSLY